MLVNYFVFVWLVVVEIDLAYGCGPQIDSLGFSVSIETDMVLSGWSILTWFQCVFVGRKRFGLSIRIGTDLDFVVWCSIENLNGCGVLTDRYVGYVLEHHSVAVDSVAQRLILYRRAIEVRASNSCQGWLSSLVVYPPYTNNRGPGFKSDQNRSSVFPEMHFSQIWVFAIKVIQPIIPSNSKRPDSFRHHFDCVRDERIAKIASYHKRYKSRIEKRKDRLASRSTACFLGTRRRGTRTW